MFSKTIYFKTIHFNEPFSSHGVNLLNPVMLYSFSCLKQYFEFVVHFICKICNVLHLSSITHGFKLHGWGILCITNDQCDQQIMKCIF